MYLPKTSRRLGAHHPDIGAKGPDHFEQEALAHVGREESLSRLMGYLGRAVNVDPPARIAVIGCGPAPVTIRWLLDKGFEIRGVEPVADFVTKAAGYLGRADVVGEGSAESSGLPDDSQDLVLLESVLEHVDSVSRTLHEAFRIVKPRGAVYVVTTNRYHPDLFGRAEFNVRAFNWLPALVKESYVYKHLHYAPALANYSARPAVHWHTFDGLCRQGREAGFSGFYSLIDLLMEDDPAVQRSLLRKAMVRSARTSPWLRAAAIAAQPVTSILMLKP